MLQVNPEFLENQTPPSESTEALVKPSQGEVWPPSPVAIEKPLEERSIPMWQAALRAFPLVAVS